MKKRYNYNGRILFDIVGLQIRGKIKSQTFNEIQDLFGGNSLVSMMNYAGEIRWMIVRDIIFNRFQGLK